VWIKQTRRKIGNEDLLLSWRQ
jgi:hypothetical protein